MSRPAIIPLNEIKRGDLIDIGANSYLALVYATAKNAIGEVTGFDYIPVRIHQKSYRGKNDKNNFIIPAKVKKQLGLNRFEQYRVDFSRLEEFKSLPTNSYTRLARTLKIHFGIETLDRMTRKIRDEEELAAHVESPPKVIVFRNKEATHMKEKRKPSDAKIADITIYDAFQAGIIDETLYDILSSAKYGRKTELPRLKELYDLATSDNGKKKARYDAIVRSGIENSSIMLRRAFHDGAISESTSILGLNRQKVTTLGAAVKAVKANTVSFNEDMRELYLQDFLEAPPRYVGTSLRSAWRKFMDAVVHKPGTLSGFETMYPR